MALKSEYKMYPLPETGYVRLPTILAVFPVSKSTWWNGIKEGRFPHGHKLGPRTTAWLVGDIRKLIDESSGKSSA